MFKRKIEDYLIEWKKEKNKKPLIIKGLRQVGKTYIAKEFAKKNYENAFIVDFRKLSAAHNIFDGDFNIDSIVLQISMLPQNDIQIIPNSKMIPFKTIIIFDEIQDCPNARSSLKYFMEDGRFDIISTGSLLGIKGYRLSNSIYRGIGVGSEETIELRPMDFEEFLWALNVPKEEINYIIDCYNIKKQIPEYAHKKFGELFKKYILIGGMPAVLKKFIETNDFNEVKKEQKNLIDNYISDFGTHLNEKNEIVVNELEKAKILSVFESIPRQLAKENKKFQYSSIKKGADGRSYKSAIDWLKDYGLITTAHNLETIDEPLGYFSIDNQFKVYMSDTGLFVSMLDSSMPLKIIQDDLGAGKGMIYENVIADIQYKNFKDLFYFSKDSGLEIDFVSIINNEVTIIEVKANSGNTKSAKEVLENSKYKVDKLIKITSQNIGVVGNITTVPQYLAFIVFKSN